MEKSKKIRELDYLTLKALKANGLSTCDKCPIGQLNYNERYMKLCTFAFVKGYKNAYRKCHRNKK